jgi:hypothetical protein
MLLTGKNADVYGAPRRRSGRIHNAQERTACLYYVQR